MDGQRFDDLARRIGSGLSRRQLMRVLLGGAGALTGTAVLKDQVAAQGGFGDPCEIDGDCENGLTCSANDTCQCNPSTSEFDCPDGTWHSELTKFLDGQCCNGNGNCCSNDCGPDGFCIELVGETCSEQGVECGTTEDCCEDLTCVGGFCAASCATECVPCETCWNFGEGDECLPDCGETERCCDNECLEVECCVAGDCGNVNECYRPECYAGTCIYHPADDLCEGDCEFCEEDGSCAGACTGETPVCCPGEPDVCAECCDAGDCLNTEDCFDAACYQGECVYTPNTENCDPCETCDPGGFCFGGCEGEDICCPGILPICAECCDASNCTATNECFEAACYQGACVYTPASDLCTGECEFCNDEGECLGCPIGQICCGEQCLEAECCDQFDCTATNECYEPSCYLGQCIYFPTDELCDGCETCNVDGVCDDNCPTGQVCCDDVCFEGDCCVDTDCPDNPCFDDACIDHQCSSTNVCTSPPELCCALEGQEEYCYNLDEGECCLDEECGGAIISTESCLVPACVHGLCVEIPDDERCDEGTCCCEDKGICSAECCPPACKSDTDCGKDECCCENGTCSHDCCPAACKSDADCPKGSCCCRDGSCSIGCCPDTTTTSVPIDELPNTGAGPDAGDASWIAGAALLGGAAALIGTKLIKDGATPAEKPEDA